MTHKVGQSPAQASQGVRRRPALLERGHRLALGVLGLATVIALSACSMVAPLIAPTATLTPKPSPTATATSTATLTPTATLTLTPTPTPSPTPVPLEASVMVEPGAVRQGRTCRLTVHTNLPSTIVGSHVHRTFGFVSEDGLQHRAVFGISALAEIASPPVTVTIQAEDGRSLVLHVSIQVVSGEYAQETITLSPETARLLDPEITQPEMEFVEGIYATYTPLILWDASFEWPIDPRITSHFGTRRSYGGQVTGFHAGVDLGAPAGTPVLAPAPGVVLAAEELQVRGNAVFVDHGAGVVSGYYHLTEMSVEPGQTVAVGDQLGTVGSTGLSTGAHLHWEIRVLGTAVDPVEWLDLPAGW